MSDQTNQIAAIALTVRKRLECLAKDASDEWAGVLMDEAKAVEQVIKQWPTPHASEQGAWRIAEAHNAALSQRPTPATGSELKDDEGRSLSDIQEFERLSLGHDDPTLVRSKPDSDSVDDFLLPCPFCGSDNVGVEPLVGGFVVDCKDCGGGCGTCHDEQSARDEWNKRKSLREVLMERGIDSDKVTASIEAMVSAATPSSEGNKRPWTEGKPYKWSEICGHFEEVQPRDCGEVFVRMTEGLKRLYGLFIGGDKRPILREGEKVTRSTLERIACAMKSQT